MRSILFRLLLSFSLTILVVTLISGVVVCSLSRRSMGALHLPDRTPAAPVPAARPAPKASG